MQDNVDKQQKIIINFLLKDFIQIFHIAKDINTYSVDHTGANTQLGGLKVGKINCEYQGSLKVEVI